MKILVLNCGSSSIKYQLMDMPEGEVLASGRVERVGFMDSIVIHNVNNKEKYNNITNISDHKKGIKLILDLLIDSNLGVLSNYSEIDAIGHRVVHGGEYFSQSVVITEEVELAIKRCIELAPLHNPANLLGIEAIKEIISDNIVQIAVFDTAFHQTIPEKAFLYPIPLEKYNNYKVRKYGFHGISHEYVTNQAVKLLNLNINNVKIISCHIGNGASVTAIKNGFSVDTSMGMTPLEGLMMGTRSGDIDPAAVLYIMNKEKLTTDDISKLLNNKSGLLGISGISSDMREIEEKVAQDDKNAILALNMYEYRIRKYIGAYIAAMNGVDVIIFTAGVGENSALLRKMICEKLDFFNIYLDNNLNEHRTSKNRIISKEESKVKIVVIPTNEELMIAKDTFNLIKN